MTNGDVKKTGKKSSSKLGHDPLAWIDPGESVESVMEQSAEQKETHMNTQSQPNVRVQDQEKMILTLPSYFGIAQAEAVHLEMQKVLNSGCNQVDIAGNEVESMDTTALQLVLSFFKEAKTLGINLSWISCSNKIESVAEMTNTGAELNLQV